MTHAYAQPRTRANKQHKNMSHPFFFTLSPTTEPKGYGRVMSHIWMSQVANANESRRTYE